ncbi:hypothetical protein BJY04DRAFT_89372 [Aspergillus karnatakaensis]|uniref:uncharacterized protein n=1 Tax=Aspergillus karnatakaensis TaxID=1810916 RepID=UPI003CCDD528
MYRYDLETGHCLIDSYMPSEAIPNPTTMSINRIEDFPRWSHLGNADFRSIYLTKSGAVLYNGYVGPFMFVDEEGLRTGRLSLVEFKQNGEIGNSILIRPYNMRWLYLNLFVLGKGLEEVRNCEGGYRHQNTPMDMDAPILDILSRALGANELAGDMALCNVEQWREDIELYASGYLALEAAGLGETYDLKNLVEPVTVEGVRKRIWDRLEAGLDPRFQVLAKKTGGGMVMPALQMRARGQMSTMNPVEMLAEIARRKGGLS